MGVRCYTCYGKQPVLPWKLGELYRYRLEKEKIIRYDLSILGMTQTKFLRVARVAAELDEELSRDLDMIRKNLGIRSYAEVIRVLIKQKAKEFKEKKPEGE